MGLQEAALRHRALRARRGRQGRPGQDVTGVPFEAIMEMLDDEVLDPVAALSLNLKESGVQSKFSTSGSGSGDNFSVKNADVGMTDYSVEKASLPITVVYQG